MIALIKGTVEEKQEKALVILTASGVGYKAGVSSDLLSKTKIDQEIKLFIHSHVKEDAFDLFGFETKDELNLFELLISVSGVGPKTAMLVMSSGSAEEITGAIAKGDTGFFTDTPGIGTKGAQRIIVDLRSKVGALGDFDLTEELQSENKQVIDALRGFGFKESEVKETINSFPKDKKMSIEEKIKFALRSLSK